MVEQATADEVKKVDNDQSARSEEEIVKEIEAILRKNIQNKCLTDDAFNYMSLLVNEDCPKNALELNSLIIDFLTDGMTYTEDQSLKKCETIIKILLDKKLIKIEQRDTIVADKLDAPIVINDMKMGLSAGVVRDEDFLDPFIGMERTQNNFNESYKAGELDKAAKRSKKVVKDALDKKIEEFMAVKNRVPPPEVKHEKGDGFKKDIMIQGITLLAGGKPLLGGATLRLNRGKKYGLIGRNGIGKTTLINAISRSEIEKFPQGIHILQVEQEVQGDDITVLQHILNCDVERTKLMEEFDQLMKFDDKEFSEEEKAENNARIAKIQDRLESIDAKGAEAKAIQILTGIGFSQQELHKPSKKFSGGWRMRIAIAKVIFCEPEILMLDEPTNHLDLNALIWLENYILNLDITIIIVSHARDFLNATVDEIIHFQGQKLTYYTGNFEQFEKTRSDKVKLAQKTRQAQQDKIGHIQKFIDKFRFNAKRASLVQSRIKAINRINVVDEVIMDPTCVFMFPNPEKISPPLCRLDECNIGYSEGNDILKKVNMNIDMDTRIALIGPNGAGKSTLLKALTGQLEASDGYQFMHNRLRVGVFTQHFADSLEMRLSAVEQLHQKYPGEHAEKFRQHLGAFGISGNLALRPMYLLSGGQKSRVAFAMITWEKPHILFLDEPTNHLDFDAINALIVALNNFEGGLLVVSHDEYFLSALCDKLFVVNKGKCQPFEGDINDYRKSLNL